MWRAMRIERHPADGKGCSECGGLPRKRRPDCLYRVWVQSAVVVANLGAVPTIKASLDLCRKCLRELGRQIRETDSRRR